MVRLLLMIYSALYTLLLVFYLPFYYYRSRTEGRRLHLAERAGRLPHSLLNERGGDAARKAAPTQRRKGAENPPAQGTAHRRVWIHAVSVGEANVIKPLVEAFAAGGDQLFISTTTETGQAVAKKLYENCATIFYFPLDWKWSCGRYLHAVRPDVVLLAETEIWPNFLFEARQHRVPVAVVNGRLSDKSIGRYRRVRRLLRPVLSLVDTFCMQSRQDRDRIIELGAPAARVHRVGNLKYDYELRTDPEKARLVGDLVSRLKPEAADLLWITGSSREGEEEQLAETYLALRSEFPALRWLLAPRHPHRAADIVRLLADRGIQPALRSRLGPGDTRVEVLVLDTIGELAHLYQFADLVFVGGSLVPWGGHNIIEAANFGKPILVGPHMENFSEITETFLAAYAVIQVKDKDELLTRARDLLRDPATRKWLGGNARRVVRENQGAVKHTVEIIRNLR